MGVYRKTLRIWITIYSFLGFLIGWSFIAKTEEVETGTSTNMLSVEALNLPEIPSVSGAGSDITVNGNVQSFSVITPTPAPATSVSSAPVIRTGGS